MLVPQAVSEELQQTHRQTDTQTDRIALYILDKFLLYLFLSLIFCSLPFSYDIRLREMEYLFLLMFGLLFLRVRPTNCNTNFKTTDTMTTSAPVVSNESQINMNCNMRYNYFLSHWTQGQLPLTHLLDDLKTYKCPQFTDECENRTFALNEFSKLVYDRFCDYETFSYYCSNGMYFRLLYLILAKHCTCNLVVPTGKKFLLREKFYEREFPHFRA